MKKLSVITVTYNAERTIERTLRSVYEQTCSHIEHIIVDGKSTDATVELIRGYERPSLNGSVNPTGGFTMR